MAGLVPKRPQDSRCEMTEMILPGDANALGTALGGKVMQWIDICAAIAAQRHCRKSVVTAHIDELNFLAPIRVGMVAVLKARVNAAFHTSLELEVSVHSENPLTGEERHCCSALLTFAALDDLGRPSPVPPLLLETDEDRARSEAAGKRRAHRLEARKRAEA